MADVFDVNEHTPTFTHQQTERVFDTTPKVGEFVIQVTATDKDTGQSTLATLNRAQNQYSYWK